jgi:radical SAM-linked protein
MERLLIKFTKNNEAKFISHLDTMRTINRAIRRAEVPIHYSKGFNPHASISVAAPLSLGIGSVAEYADIELDEFVEGNTIKAKLNEVLPQGIKILEAINIREKMPTSMGSVEGAKYNIRLSNKLSEEEVNGVIKSILDSNEIMKMKKSKSGEKLVNIRPMIKNIKLVNFSGEQIEIECLLQAGSNGSLSPDIVADVLKGSSDEKIHGYPDTLRTELYASKNEQWVDLGTYFSGK